jgi:O-antigen/teichoic acid export membrane protein
MVRTLVTALTIVLLPVFIVSVLAGDDLLRLAYGERFGAAHRYLVLLMVGNIGLVTLGVSSMLLLMAGRQRLAMALSLGWIAVAAPVAVPSRCTIRAICTCSATS